MTAKTPAYVANLLKSLESTDSSATYLASDAWRACRAAIAVRKVRGGQAKAADAIAARGVSSLAMSALGMTGASKSGAERWIMAAAMVGTAYPDGADDTPAATVRAVVRVLAPGGGKVALDADAVADILAGTEVSAAPKALTDALKELNAPKGDGGDTPESGDADADDTVTVSADDAASVMLDAIAQAMERVADVFANGGALTPDDAANLRRIGLAYNAIAKAAKSGQQAA